VDRPLEIRRVLGGIYSTCFSHLRDHDEDGYLKALVIHGAGFGHGVGMCQMGAYMMAKRGYNYRQILGHYYKGVQIRRLYR
jgi:SpoIID/LytB domain protein